MTVEKEDYSDYISYLSTSINLGALFAAFTLTVITLLVTQLPDPSLFFAQVTLFFLAFIFDLLLFLLSWSVWFVIYFCERVPPMTRIARIATIAAHSSRPKICFPNAQIVVARTSALSPARICKSSQSSWKVSSRRRHEHHYYRTQST